MNRKYSLIESKYDNCKVDLDVKKLNNGFNFYPKNNNEHPGLDVSSMTINSRNFVEHILKKKVSRKLENYINYIMSLVNDNSDESGSLLGFVLNDVEKFKAVVRGKYAEYLDEHYIELLMKKIDLLERELKVKQFYYNEQINVYEEKKGRSR